MNLPRRMNCLARWKWTEIKQMGTADSFKSIGGPIIVNAFSGVDQLEQINKHFDEFISSF